MTTAINAREAVFTPSSTAPAVAERRKEKRAMSDALVARDGDAPDEGSLAERVDDEGAHLPSILRPDRRARSL